MGNLSKYFFNLLVSPSLLAVRVGVDTVDGDKEEVDGRCQVLTTIRSWGIDSGRV